MHSAAEHAVCLIEDVTHILFHLAANVILIVIIIAHRAEVIIIIRLLHGDDAAFFIEGLYFVIIRVHIYIYIIVLFSSS